jgi:hypothetical protein
MAKKGIDINIVIAYLKTESASAKRIDLSGNSLAVRRFFNGATDTTSRKVVYRNTKNFNRMKNYVLKNGSIDEIIQMANAGIKTLNFAEIEEFVKSSNDPRSAYRFVKSFPNVDCRDYEKIILKSNDPEYIAKYCVACNPNEYQLRKFENALCGITDNLEARKSLAIFFKHVKNADRDKVGKAFIDTYFSKDMPSDCTYPTVSEENVKREVSELFTKHAKLRNDKKPYEVFVGTNIEKDDKLKLELLDYLDYCARYQDYEQIRKQRNHKSVRER